MTNKIKIIFPTLLGSVVEYYDFGIYAVFVPIISSLFFPQSSQFIQILCTFIVFAFGFLMRPLGGFVFGFIGDRFGRKIALNISIMGMAISTLSLGALPTYDQIGIYSTVILVIIRVVQGLCIGGEGAGAAIFMLEHLSNKSLSFIGSMIMAASMFGTLFANLVGLSIEHWFGLDHFTWRYGFFLGATLGLFGAVIRAVCGEETPIFDELKNNNRILKTPFITLMREKWKTVMLAVGIACIATSTAYMIRGYLNTYFIQILRYDVRDAFCFTSFSLIALIMLLPIFALISNFIGHVRFFTVIAIALIFLIFPIFHLISNKAQDVYSVYLGLSILSALAAAISAPAYPYIINAFPPEFRYSGVAVGWNIGNALFGGTTPVVSAVLVEEFGVEAPAYYLVSTAIIFLIISQIMQRYSYERLRKLIVAKKLLKI